MNEIGRLRQYLAKASFASEQDRFSALECLGAIERAQVTQLGATVTVAGRVEAWFLNAEAAEDWAEVNCPPYAYTIAEA